MALKDVLLYLIFILKKTSKQTQINKKHTEKHVPVFKNFLCTLLVTTASFLIKKLCLSIADNSIILRITRNSVVGMFFH